MNLKGFAGLFLGLSIGVSAPMTEEEKLASFKRDFNSLYRDYIEPYYSYLDEIDTPAADSSRRYTLKDDWEYLKIIMDVESTHQWKPRTGLRIAGYYLRKMGEIGAGSEKEFEEAIRRRLRLDNNDGNPIGQLVTEATEEIHNIWVKHRDFVGKVEAESKNEVKLAEEMRRRRNRRRRFNAGSSTATKHVYPVKRRHPRRR